MGGNLPLIHFFLSLGQKEMGKEKPIVCSAVKNKILCVRCAIIDFTRFTWQSTRYLVSVQYTEEYLLSMWKQTSSMQLSHMKPAFCAADFLGSFLVYYWGAINFVTVVIILHNRDHLHSGIYGTSFWKRSLETSFWK